MYYYTYSVVRVYWELYALRRLFCIQTTVEGEKFLACAHRSTHTHAATAESERAHRGPCSCQHSFLPLLGLGGGPDDDDDEREGGERERDKERN